MKIIIAIAAVIIPLSMYGGEEIVGYLGVSTQDLSEAMKIALDVEEGLLVAKIYEGSPAEVSGINVGDLMTKIDGQEIEDHKTLKAIVRAHPNKAVNISLRRKGKIINKTVTLGAREKSRIMIDVDIPEIPDLKVILGTKELQENITELRAEIDELRKELEHIRKQLK